MSPITVLGASGFIGSALVKRLKETNLEFIAPGRNEKLAGRELGDILYCVGLTADFRSRPFDTVEAHVCHLARVLQDCDFKSLVYLSSARVYERCPAPAREEDPIQMRSSNHDDLYCISKIMGESLALASGQKTTIVRLSNVYGSDFASKNFLSSIITEAISKARTVVHNAPDAEKDYVSIHDVVDILIEIAAGGKERIYNLASGMNVSNYELTQKIARLTGCEIEFQPGAPKTTFPPISIDRLQTEFAFRPRRLIDDLDKLVEAYKKNYADQRDKLIPVIRKVDNPQSKDELE